jgi:hypothetical protein
MRALPQISTLTLTLATVFVAGCGPNATPATTALPVAPGSQSVRTSASSPKTPELITVDAQADALEYFQIQHNGSKTLKPLSGSLGISQVYAMAADGNLIVIANYSPAEIITYNLQTKAETTMSDPYGGPFDVAVDKQGNIYAMSSTTVAVYKAGSSQPTEMTCSSINLGEAIAVDNEGDVFVNGYGPGSFMGVVEYPAGSQSCVKLHLRTERGYIAGVGVDPKTDDLIVVDDPDLCAGGLEGRMIIYPKPYRARTSVRRVLNATYCSGTFRLDASSTHIFYSDASVSAGVPIIDQARYPSGKSEGQYWLGYYSNDSFSGFTTIPNKLPN